MTKLLLWQASEGRRPSRLEFHVAGWGYARLASDQIAGYRRLLPAWASANVAHHFLKHADEQTVLAVRAVDNLLGRGELKAEQTSGWAIIAAPEFLGRQSLAVNADRFRKQGVGGLSPHGIPQHSLHSVSGALSILLASHGPNVGLGGGRGAIVHGLLAAATLFDHRPNSGCWMLLTGWDPEPLPDEQGNVGCPATCHAVALALCGDGHGRGRLMLSDVADTAPESDPPITVARLVTELEQLDAAAGSRTLEWRLGWGATLSLELTGHAVPMLRAA